LNLLDLRQNVLLKNVLGIRRYARAKALLNVLRIEQIKHTYLKHKIFGLKQFNLNCFSRDFTNYLQLYYLGCSPSKESFVQQLNVVEELIGHTASDYKKAIEILDGKFAHNDLELKEELLRIINDFDINFFYICIYRLNSLLWVDFG